MIFLRGPINLLMQCIHACICITEILQLFLLPTSLNYFGKTIRVHNGDEAAGEHAEAGVDGNAGAGAGANAISTSKRSNNKSKHT